MWVAETEKKELDNKREIKLKYGEIRRINGSNYYQVTNPSTLWFGEQFGVFLNPTTCNDKAKR
jgi:hypothetical protein